MVSIIKFRKIKQQYTSRLNSLAVVLMYLLLFNEVALARQWRFIPSLSLSETYSDNINLSPDGLEKSAFVTQISPGLSVRRRIGRNKVNLDYRLQGLYNAGGDNAFNLNHQLQFNSDTILRRNSLSLGLRASISQQNATNVRSANDNISGGANRTNVYTYGVSPVWTPYIGGYVNGVVRFDYNVVDTDKGLASNTEIFSESITLNSGKRFSRFNWSLAYTRRDENRQNGNDVQSQNASASFRVFPERRLSVFANVGYTENKFQSTTDNNQNGVFYNAGARWNPSPRFSAEVGIGNNSFVTVDAWLARHLRWVTTYQYNSVGTNTGNVWNTNLNFITKRANWRVTYFEDTTTSQAVLSQLQTFNLVDAFGDPINDPVTNQPVQFDISLPTLTNEVFIRRRGELNYAYRTGKSTINAQVFGEKRSFQVRQNDELVIGVNASWNWNFTRNTSLQLRPAWQSIKRTNLNLGNQNIQDFKDDRFDFSLSVRRRIPVKLGQRSVVNASIEYRYLNQLSDVVANEFQENRVTANLLMKF